MPNKILILFAHPSQHRSEINLPLIQASSSIEDGKLEEHIETWQKILICLQQNRIDVDRAAQADKLNECVSAASPVTS